MLDIENAFHLIASVHNTKFATQSFTDFADAKVERKTYKTPLHPTLATAVSEKPTGITSISIS